MDKKEDIYYLDSKINDLKLSFNKIKESRAEIKRIFEILSSKIEKLKSIYGEFLKNNNNTSFIFGLDSFNFQNKLIDIEYNQMIDFYMLLSNRLYCDYYKLFTIMQQYIHNELHTIIHENELKTIQNSMKIYKYEKYDYINTMKTYAFEQTCALFTDIIGLIISLNDISKTNSLELSNYKTKVNTGISIENFIHTFSYQNSILDDKIMLYVNYLDFFLTLHTKYYIRFITKLKIMFGQINHDIKLDDPIKNGRSKRKEIIKEIKGNIHDNAIINDLNKTLNYNSKGTTPTSSSSNNSTNNINDYSDDEAINQKIEPDIDPLNYDTMVDDKNDISNTTQQFDIEQLFNQNETGSLAKQGFQEFLTSAKDIEFELNNNL